MKGEIKLNIWWKLWIDYTWMWNEVWIICIWYEFIEVVMIYLLF